MKSVNKSFDEKGSIVVEASLVFPIVFLAIIVIIYTCLLIYQKTYIQSLADMAAERGAAIWSNPAKEISSGRVSKEELKSGGLYWRIFDLKSPERIKNIEEYLKKKLNAYNVLGSFRTVKVEIQDCIIYKKLVVSINDTYRIPVGKLLRIFGLEENYNVFVKSEAVINEPVEFIRNTDFTLDIEKELEEKYPDYGKAIESIRSVMSKVKEKIADLKFDERKVEKNVSR